MMTKRRMYLLTQKIPISVTWSQELVDDGSGGENFYMRVTPHINLGGKAGTPRLVVDKLGGKSPSLVPAANYAAYAAQFKETLKREHMDKIKKEAKKEIKEILRGGNRQQPSTPPTNGVSQSHIEALRRQRMAREDEELKRQQAAEEAASRKQTMEATKKLMEQTTNEEELAFMQQLLHGNRGGYSSIMKELQETKTYDEDDEY